MSRLDRVFVSPVAAALKAATAALVLVSVGGMVWIIASGLAATAARERDLACLVAYRQAIPYKLRIGLKDPADPCAEIERLIASVRR